jgi:hypothetical protein
MKYPFKKPVHYGRTKVCFALKAQAERLWLLARKYQRSGNVVAVNECRRLAFESAKSADIIASKPESETSITDEQP